ncbi:HAD family hydrolase [Sphingomonas sp. BIUV-7]|uniref:HAD family hydrolase n=1 Tax=Sphingomonas natans TaxID=3063330 RepID=A0ABT8YF46_9SPHN|nr:HAD family hydrolase [Sphingomonas sp. BIUV-7]MDO6416309.1 HAD family hydrolase [Sphingomonas sp. BIUV-7]
MPDANVRRSSGGRPRWDFSQMAIRAILFDIDGTLVDSNDMHVLAWEQAFADIDVRFDRQVVHDQIGKGTDMLVPSLLPDADQAEQERLGKIQGDVFKSRFLHQVRPFAGAHDLLVHVANAGQKVVLASSASQAELDHYLDLLDVRDLVSATTSADDVEQTKPAPDIFAVALEKVSPLKADEALVVGDTPYDIEAAAKCGIAAVGLRSGGFSDQSLFEAGAIELYDDVASLLRGYNRSTLAAASVVG